MFMFMFMFVCMCLYGLVNPSMVPICLASFFCLLSSRSVNKPPLCTTQVATGLLSAAAALASHTRVHAGCNARYNGVGADEALIDYCSGSSTSSGACSVATCDAAYDAAVYVFMCSPHGEPQRPAWLNHANFDSARESVIGMISNETTEQECSAQVKPQNEFIGMHAAKRAEPRGPTVAIGSQCTHM